MPVQVGNAMPLRAYFTYNKQGATGLSVTVDVYNPAGSQVVSAASATEIGDGLYGYSIPSTYVTSAGNYTAVFKTSNTNPDFQQVPANDQAVPFVPANDPMDDLLSAHTVTGSVAAALTTLLTSVGVDPLDQLLSAHTITGSLAAALTTILGSPGLADPLAEAVPGSYATNTAGAVIGEIPSILTALAAGVEANGFTAAAIAQLVGALNGVVITTNTTPANGGNVTVIVGDAYVSDSLMSRLWTWTLSGAGVPNLAGATGVFIAADTGLSVPITFTGSNPYTVTLALTAAETQGLAVGQCQWGIRFETANEVPVTLLTGVMTVKAIY